MKEKRNHRNTYGTLRESNDGLKKKYLRTDLAVHGATCALKRSFK